MPPGDIACWGVGTGRESDGSALTADAVERSVSSAAARDPVVLKALYNTALSLDEDDPLYGAILRCIRQALQAPIAVEG